MSRTACLLTSFNRPRLVTDAIQSVLAQTDRDLHLIIMDDASNDETLSAIRDATGLKAMAPAPTMLQIQRGEKDGIMVTLCRLPDRSLIERKRTISYSRSINFALNRLLTDERYICYLVDDDFLFPESIQTRADFLVDANPNTHVCYGRLRALQYAPAGRFNTWDAAAAPVAGMHFPRPTGRRELIHDGKAAYVYFDDGSTDPQTGLPYVEEAMWKLGPMLYGADGQVDHNQPMHRRKCLTHCRSGWYGPADLGGFQYWGEDRGHGVGDAAFLRLLGEVHAFYGIDAWVASKRYHVFSDGVQSGEIRE